ncbi:MAG: SemiSWEET transporter [Bacteroidota bacterium]
MNYVDALGFVAAVLTTGAFLPQAIKVIKSKNTNDLSLSMYSMLVGGVCLWLIYGFILESWPIILANGITLILSSIILFLKIRYK